MVMEKHNLIIETWEVERVKPYDRNPRRIPQSAVDKVAASIRTFGWRQPIVVDKRGVIIAGHTRALAAQALGLSHVPVHVANSMTAKQARAYRLADNRVGEESSWDLDALAIELTDFAGDADVLDAIGFDNAELAHFLKATPDVSELELDDAPRLDVLGDEVKCPQCGHSWQRS